MLWGTFVVLGLVLLVLVLLSLLLSLPWPGVTVANAERIQQGMTLREVEILLGGPGKMGSYRWDGGGDGPFARTWHRGEVYIQVRLDAAGRVQEKKFDGPPPVGYLDYLRRLFVW
jgi:hypothetical protein